MHGQTVLPSLGALSAALLPLPAPPGFGHAWCKGFNLLRDDACNLQLVRSAKECERGANVLATDDGNVNAQVGSSGFDRLANSLETDRAVRLSFMDVLNDKDIWPESGEHLLDALNALGTAYVLLDVLVAPVVWGKR